MHFQICYKVRVLALFVALFSAFTSVPCAYADPSLLAVTKTAPENAQVCLIRFDSKLAKIGPRDVRMGHTYEGAGCRFSCDGGETFSMDLEKTVTTLQQGSLCLYRFTKAGYRIVTCTELEMKYPFEGNAHFRGTQCVLTKT